MSERVCPHWEGNAPPSACAICQGEPTCAQCLKPILGARRFIRVVSSANTHANEPSHPLHVHCVEAWLESVAPGLAEKARVDVERLREAVTARVTWGGSSAGTIEGVPPGAGVIPEHPIMGQWSPAEIRAVSAAIDAQQEAERLRAERDELLAMVERQAHRHDCSGFRCSMCADAWALVDRIKGERG